MQILQALIEADDPEAIPILIDCLGSNHHATVRFAAESIGAMAKKQKDICNMAVSELVDALASENVTNKKKCIKYAPASGYSTLLFKCNQQCCER